MALAQAAQHLATHPGTLGVFFRRLAHKKNRNVAVMATSRKLVVIAYELLSRGEPYRYAQPAPTAEKLRRLRLRTGGPRRTTGCPGAVRGARRG
jgi:transposase